VTNASAVSALPSAGEWPTQDPRVYVVLVNWNSWQNTIECLESVLRSDYSNYQVVVCDNASTDGSWERLIAWSGGFQEAPRSPHPQLGCYTSPPVPKPLEVVTYQRDAAELGGDTAAHQARLVLIQTGSNLGFSGGNNVGLRYALARTDLEYAWLLNNDTIVPPSSMKRLVQRMQQRPDAGLCGSTLVSYYAPELIQARGGVAYNRWFATMKPIAKGRQIVEEFDRDEIERRMDYVAGASTLVSRRFLETVGLLNERYFLYCEELDWATRSAGRFALAYSPESTVYHKEGGSVSKAADERFNVADYYIHRSRIRYTRRFFPVALPAVVLRTFAAVLARVVRRQPRRAWTIFRLLLSPKTYALGQDSEVP
jgi:GT2 family glycosyltransferase